MAMDHYNSIWLKNKPFFDSILLLLRVEAELPLLSTCYGACCPRCTGTCQCIFPWCRRWYNWNYHFCVPVVPVKMGNALPVSVGWTIDLVWVQNITGRGPTSSSISFSSIYTHSSALGSKMKSNISHFDFRWSWTEPAQTKLHPLT